MKKKLFWESGVYIFISLSSDPGLSLKGWL